MLSSSAGDAAGLNARESSYKNRQGGGTLNHEVSRMPGIWACQGKTGKIHLVQAMYGHRGGLADQFSTVLDEEAVLGSIRAVQKEFDMVLLDVIEDCFRETLGEAAAERVLLHLERNDGLRREEIPHCIEEFDSGLTGLLGPGAQIFERLVIMTLCSKLQLKYKVSSELSFADHVQKIRSIKLAERAEGGLYEHHIASGIAGKKEERTLSEFFETYLTKLRETFKDLIEMRQDYLSSDLCVSFYTLTNLKDFKESFVTKRLRALKGSIEESEVMSLPRGTVKKLMKGALEKNGKADCIISRKAIDAMNEEITNHIKVITDNAYGAMKENGRKTILPRDIKTKA